MKRKPLTVAGVIVVAASLALAGCSGANSNSTEGSIGYDAPAASNEAAERPAKGMETAESSVAADVAASEEPMPPRYGR